MLSSDAGHDRCRLEIKMLAFAALAAIPAVIALLAMAHDVIDESFVVTNPALMAAAAGR